MVPLYVALSQVNHSYVFEFVLKELLIALFNGVICALITLVFCYVTKSDLALSYTIGLSILAVFTYAGLFGTFVPLILNKYKIDPALATGPFITTLNDVVGLFIYFTIGMMMYNL